MNAYLFSLNKDANIADQWDFGMLNDFLNGDLWKPPTWEDFKIKQAKTLPKDDRAIVVIPARHHKGLEAKVNTQLAKIKHVVLFLMGDEEADFEVELIDHPSIHIWVQNPHVNRHDAYNKIGTGYPQHMKKILKAIKSPINKNKDLFFSGQVTHQRRDELIGALKTTKHDAVFHETDGFTKGMTHLDYYMDFVGARVAPAPSGAVIPDSFRFFEALECMAVPIADNKTPDGQILAYWDWLFGEITPLRTISNWAVLDDITADILHNYPTSAHVTTEWWIRWKRNFAYKVLEQLDV